MLHHPTVERLLELRLFSMAATLAEQQSQQSIDQLGFEERLGLLVKREATERQSRQTTARLRRAELRYPAAVPEDINLPARARAQSHAACAVADRPMDPDTAKFDRNCEDWTRQKLAGLRVRQSRMPSGPECQLSARIGAKKATFAQTDTIDIP